MPSGVQRLTDVVVPVVFTPMVQRLSVDKTPFITSGAAAHSDDLDVFLAGAGLTVNMPKGNVLDTTDVENVSSDDPTVFSTPNKMTDGTEIAVRLSRNNSWSRMDLVTSLRGADPLDAVANQVAQYRAVRRQMCMVAMVSGIFANNITASDAYHTQNDMQRDVSGASYSAGVTNFGGPAFVDAQLTMGDAMASLSIIMVHPVVFGNMRKANMITFVQPSEVSPGIPYYQGARVIIDKTMPNAGGVFESWLFAAGAFLYGDSQPEDATETIRVPSAGNGGGQETLHNRWEWAHHIPGYAYIGTPANGGPSNANTTNNLASASSWRRVATDRRYTPIARMITREY